MHKMEKFGWIGVGILITLTVLGFVAWVNGVGPP